MFYSLAAGAGPFPPIRHIGRPAATGTPGPLVDASGTLGGRVSLNRTYTGALDFSGHT